MRKRMDFLELAKKRCSCRKYDKRRIEREKIELCIEAARQAPSACNSQPWHYRIVDDPGLLEKTAAAAAGGIYRISRFIETAPMLIAVLADKGSFISKTGSFVRNTDFYLLDIGISAEHLVLQAAELGIGTCYIGWFNEKKVKKVLNIPGKYTVPLLISAGYPAERHRETDTLGRKAKSHTRRPSEEIVTFN